MTLVVEARGLKGVQTRLANVSVRVRTRTGSFLTRTANRIMHESKSLVPREDGHLISSAEIDPPVLTPRTISVTMSYGRTGPSKAYALAAHEHKSKYSPFSWRSAEANNRPVTFHTPGTGVKYLERPFRAESSNILATVASAKLID